MIFRSVLLKVRTLSDKFVQEIKTHSFYVQHLFFSENRAVHGIIWKNMTNPDIL